MKIAAGWIWYVILQTVTWIALFPTGVILCAVLAYSRLWYTRASRYYPDRQVTVWRGGWLTWLWGCEENGVDPGDQLVVGGTAKYLPDASPSWRAYMWTAWRNSVGNLCWVTSWKGGPWWQIHFTVRGEPWYAQAGFRPDNGWPVLSAGAGYGSCWYG